MPPHTCTIRIREGACPSFPTLVCTLQARRLNLELLVSSRRGRSSAAGPEPEGVGCSGGIWGAAVRVRPRKLNNPENTPPPSGSELPLWSYDKWL